MIVGLRGRGLFSGPVCFGDIGNGGFTRRRGEQRRRENNTLCRPD